VSARTGPRLHIERWGSGAPLVLTHGLGSSSETWVPLRPHLPAGWAVTSWDLRGHGRSAQAAVYSRDAALADLVAVVAGGADRAPAVLVGHSLGGYLSLALAVTRPELVRALVLIATGPGFRDQQRREAWNRMLVERAATLGVPPAVTGLCAQPDALVLDALDQVTVPVAAIVGERDRRFHAAAEVLHQRIGAAIHFVPGAGHHPHETHPATVAAATGVLLEALEGQ
jgi:pimeloyl-ACP methyl ester carboxylesterase